MPKPNTNLPGKITTEKEALAAVRKRGRALQFVPYKCKTLAICLEAMEHDKHARQTFQFVPEKLRIAVHYYLNGSD
jgi:hypothetical protein